MRRFARLLYHYLRFQAAIAVASLRESDRKPDASGVPIPPARLRYRVHGGLAIEPFLEIGRRITADISALLQELGRPLRSFEAVLDFGCGCGRFLRNLADAPAGWHLTGTDIDRPMIEWCRKNLPWAHFTTNGPLPPTGFGDGTFDLIVGTSVFTHLDEAYQHRWLAELARIAKHDAILLLSVHGQYAYEHLDPSLQRRVKEQGILFLTGTTGMLKTDGLPDFYQDTYHSREYVEREWSRYFEILKYVPRGLNDHQDLVALRKR